MPENDSQLALIGFEKALRCADAEAATFRIKARNRRRIEAEHEILSSMPTVDDLSFLHSGLCQTHLPRSRPASNVVPWVRQSGRFKLVIQPGMAVQGPESKSNRKMSEAELERLYCGVPFGPKARLILIWLQSEGVKSRIVSMDKSMSAWMRSLGLAVTGGKGGTIQSVREQTLRIAQCSFSFHWSDVDDRGDTTRRVQNTRIVDGMELWEAAGDASKWSTTIQLSEDFYYHLREHAVPLDSRAIAHLAGNSLGLDLYAFFAHRLHRLAGSVTLTWKSVADQFGLEDLPTRRISQWIKETLPDVRCVYANLNVDVTRHGLILRHSSPPVPRNTVIQGARLKLIV